MSSNARAKTDLIFCPPTARVRGQLINNLYRDLYRRMAYQPLLTAAKRV